MNYEFASAWVGTSLRRSLHRLNSRRHMKEIKTFWWQEQLRCRQKLNFLKNKIYHNQKTKL